eukprot:4016498-Ditylum_brightwellii.AAC.1
MSLVTGMQLEVFKVTPIPMTDRIKQRVEQLALEQGKKELKCRNRSEEEFVNIDWSAGVGYDNSFAEGLHAENFNQTRNDQDCVNTKEEDVDLEHDTKHDTNEEESQEGNDEPPTDGATDNNPVEDNQHELAETNKQVDEEASPPMEDGEQGTTDALLSRKLVNTLELRAKLLENPSKITS